MVMILPIVDSGAKYFSLRTYKMHRFEIKADPPDFFTQNVNIRSVKSYPIN